MDLAAKHVGFVLASYAVAFLAIGGLILAIWLRARLVRHRLEELERLGAPRRRQVVTADAEETDVSNKAAGAGDDVGGTRELSA